MLDTDALDCHPFRVGGVRGYYPQKKMEFCAQIMQFCAYLHGTVVCHFQWQRVTKCHEKYMVITWASVEGCKPLVEGLEPPTGYGVQLRFVSYVYLCVTIN